MRYFPSWGAVTLTALTLFFPAPLLAQWEVWESDEVESRCGVINTTELEFTVRTCDRALVLITGQDLGFSNALVTEDGEVLINGESSGYISYQEDGEGFFTLWWITEDGFIIDFDDVTMEPFETEDTPLNFESIPCSVADDANAEEGFWDGEADCDQPQGGETMEPIQFSTEDDDQNDNGQSSTCGIGMINLVFMGYTGLWLVYRRRLL